MLEKLQRLRKEKQMTCLDVARKVDITKEYYWMIENGQRNLSYKLAVKIARVFEKNPDDIFLKSELTNKEQVAD